MARHRRKRSPTGYPLTGRALAGFYVGQMTAGGGGANAVWDTTKTLWDQDAHTWDGGPLILPPTVTPASVTLAGHATQTFTASNFTNGTVTWVETGAGTVLGGTATTLVWRTPTGAGTYTVTATGVADPSQTAVSTVSVYGVSPSAATVTAGTTQVFTPVNFTGGAVAWSAVNGSFVGSTYTAPLAVGSGSDTITATGVSDPTQVATAAVTITAVVLLLDHFTDANGVALPAHTMDTGSGWTAQAGTFWVQSNHAEPNSNADSDIVTADAGRGDYLLTCKVTPQDDGTNSANPDLVFWYLDANNYWFVDLNSKTDVVSIYERTAGTYTQRATVGVALVSGTQYTVAVTLANPFVTATFNGGSTISYGNGVTGQSRSLVGLRLGLGDGVHAPATKTQWDDFEAQQLDPLSAWVKYPNDTDPTVLAPGAGLVAVFEPNVWFSSLRGTNLLLCTSAASGAGSGQLRLYTSADGLSWGTGTAVIGGGVGGESSNTCCRASVYREGGTTYLFYADAEATGQLNLATSTDDTTFTRVATNLIPHTADITANHSVGVLKVGATYYVLFEHTTASGTYRVGLATTSSLTSGPYTVVTNELTTLGVGTGMYGRPNLWYDSSGGKYHVWYHASDGSGPSGGTLPTQPYHATSTAFPGTPDSWTVTGPLMRITERPASFAGLDNEQIADLCLLDQGSQVWMYYSANHNSPYRAVICLAKYPGTFAQLFAAIP